MEGVQLPNESFSIYQRRPPGTRGIEADARRVAREVMEEWTHSGSQDDQALVDGLQRAFLEEASHSLRQVLFQLGARVELALVKSRQGPQGPQGLDEKTAGSLMEALDRAAKIVDVYLDRSKAVQYAIRLAPEPLSLDRELHHLLEMNHFMQDPQRVLEDLSPTHVVADRERLRDVLGHLMARFWFTLRERERLVVRVHPGGQGAAEGFIGVSRSQLRVEDLIEEIEGALSVEAMEIDIPYTRAVFERHGGSFHVASDEAGTVGFGFRLPAEPPNHTPEEEENDS